MDDNILKTLCADFRSRKLPSLATVYFLSTHDGIRMHMRNLDVIVCFYATLTVILGLAVQTATM